MTINFSDNYGCFVVTCVYMNGQTSDQSHPLTLGDAMEFAQVTMDYNYRCTKSIICDAETGEVVAEFERENEDFIEKENNDEDFYDEEEEKDFWEMLEDEPDTEWMYEDEEDWDGEEPNWDLDMGFDPYEGCYTFDC